MKIKSKPEFVGKKQKSGYDSEDLESLPSINSEEIIEHEFGVRTMNINSGMSKKNKVAKQRSLIKL